MGRESFAWGFLGVDFLHQFNLEHGWGLLGDEFESPIRGI